MTTIGQGRLASENLELGSGPVGCYLIHGLTGSTFEFRGLARFLEQQDYRVSARLLPGHGTTVEECNLVRAEDWLKETEYYFTQFIMSCEVVFVIGHSMGAGLALHLAGLFPVAGVVAMSTALELDSWRLRWLLPITSRFITAIPKSKIYAGRNLDIQEYYGYQAYPAKALRQMLRLNRFVRAGLPAVSVPALIMHSHADITAPFRNGSLVYNTIASTDKTLIEFDHSSHMLPDDTEKEQVWQHIQHFINKHLDEQPDALPGR
ncbi:MAG: alpha/beta fold hydrolase [Candidatus Neomarinimicrobiota bacterium]